MLGGREYNFTKLLRMVSPAWLSGWLCQLPPCRTPQSPSSTSPPAPGRAPSTRQSDRTRGRALRRRPSLCSRWWCWWSCGRRTATGARWLLIWASRSSWKRESISSLLYHFLGSLQLAFCQNWINFIEACWLKTNIFWQNYQCHHNKSLSRHWQ